MSKHTPGPWIIIKDNGYFDIISKYGDEVISCEGCSNKDDAHLIAAAPDLLEALEAIMGSDLFEWNGSAAFWLQDKVKAAITKAKGES